MVNIHESEQAICTPERPKVLVLEDDDGLNKLICRALRGKGILTEGVRDGTQALSLLAENTYTLLLLDYMLPDMLGHEVVKSLQALNVQIPFVIMTGHGDQGVAVDMMKRGARDYIVKDSEFLDRLPMAIERVLTQLDTEKNLENTREEKAKLEEQLRQAQKMEAIGTLAGGVAHDFNNLLTAIHGYTSLAISDLDPAASKSFNQLTQVLRCAERASSLTRQLLLFSRKQTPSKTTVQLNTSINDILNMLRRLIGEDISIETDLQPDLSTISADAGNIEQVIMNIAVNSHDAMPAGGTLSIQTRNGEISEAGCAGMPGAQPGDFVCMQISDTGTGIDKETLQHIFEPFFTTKAAGKGTGLGLSTVYGILRRHDGWIHVYSEPGVGTTFRIYLPVSKSNGTSEKGEGMTSRDTAGQEDLCGHGENILIVEDNEEIREWCSIALDESGYTVHVSSEATSGLAKFKDHCNEIALVISDVIMPGKTGFQLAAELRSIKPDLKIILSSGYTGERSGFDGIRASGYGFLQKPYSMQNLLESVKNALSRGSQPVLDSAVQSA